MWRAYSPLRPGTRKPVPDRRSMDSAIIEAADHAARHWRFAGDWRPGDNQHREVGSGSDTQLPDQRFGRRKGRRMRGRPSGNRIFWLG